MSDLKVPFVVLVVCLIAVGLVGCALSNGDSFPQPPATCAITELQEGHVFLIICNEE